MLSPISFNPSPSVQARPLKIDGDKPLSALADNIVSCTNTSECMEKDNCKNIQNEIDIKWSSHLSNDGMLDFIWCPKVNLKQISFYLSDSEYSPEKGGSVIFTHSNGSDLFIKNKKLSAELFSTYITRLDGYYDTRSPLILAACKAGYENATDSIAQKLANALDRTIIASPGMVHADCNAEHTHITKIYSDRPFIAFTPSNLS